MYFATDLAPIAAALDAAFRAPRPIAEIAREQYPEAVIDRRGMPHAPHDGFVVDGVVYRGGEYLPVTGEYVGMSNGAARYPIMFYVDGETVALMGTKAQRTAAAEVAKAQAADFDRARAQHVGENNCRAEMEITLIKIFADMEGRGFGPEFSFHFRDARGNPVIYKGDAFMHKMNVDGRGNGEWRSKIPNGGTVKLVATVSHWTARDGRKATYIKRPKMVA
jgi:hypothetical protein